MKEFRSQDKLGKQNFQENIKKVFEPLTDTIKNTFEDLKNTMLLTSKENNKELENLNDKLLEIMNDRGIRATYLSSPPSKINNLEHTSQYKLLENPNSKRLNELLINGTIPIPLYNNFLTFRDKNKKFELQEDLL